MTHHRLRVRPLVAIGTWLLLVSLGASGFSFDVGFAVKPFMLVTLLLVPMVGWVERMPRWRPFEIAWMVFVASYSATALYAADPVAAFRLVLGLGLITAIYLVWRVVFQVVPSDVWHCAFRAATRLLTLFALLYYAVGLVEIGGDFGNHNHSYVAGVMVDRLLPRLIGGAGDPNIFLFAFTWALFWLAWDRRSRRWWAALALLVAVLTLSKGGLLGLAVGWSGSVVVRVVFDRRIRRSALLAPVFAVIAFTLLAVVPGPASAVIHQRLAPSNISSGRFSLWTEAWEIFAQRPLLGVGANSFLKVSAERTGVAKYVHNTYLSVLVEGGAVVTVVYLLFHLLLLVEAVRLRRRHAWLLPTLLAMQVQMAGLSLLIHEGLFFLAAFMVAEHARDAYRTVGAPTGAGTPAPGLG